MTPADTAAMARLMAWPHTYYLQKMKTGAGDFVFMVCAYEAMGWEHTVIRPTLAAAINAALDAAEGK